MISFRNITRTLNSIGVNRNTPALVHIGREISSNVKGGIESLMGALLSTVDNVMLPAFTYSTMITPEDGPNNNNIEYGVKSGNNLNAKIFSHTLPSELENQNAINILKKIPGTYRSNHPVYSFFGLGLDIALIDHAPEHPYHPIRKLMDLGGWVLMIGANPGQNFSIHFAEKLADRKQFVRWALTADGIAKIPHFPGCSKGFHKLDYYLHDEIIKATIENTNFSAVPLHTLITTATALINEDPFALLCNDLECAFCSIVRAEVKTQITNSWKSESSN